MTIVAADDPTIGARWWDGAVPPKICVWELTLACDLGCRHCGSRAGTARPNELTTVEALDVVRQLAELGIGEVTLIGGEAYLRDDWAEIAAAITAAGMACTMVTGGYGLDDFCIAEARAAGIRRIGVSIDGIGATHDRLRGRPGAFEAACAAARRITEAGIEFSVNSQINRLTLPELDPLARLLVDLGARAWQIQLTVALGRAADRPGLLLQPFHMLALMPLLARIKQEVLTPAGVALAPGNNIGYFGPFEPALRFGGARGHRWSGCLAGRAALGLEADGTLKGCPSLPTASHAAGSVRDTPLAELWRTSPVMQSLGRRTRADLWGFCARCEHADNCLGGCTWTAEALFGRPGNNPFCHHRALTLAGEGRRERLRMVEAAPGLPFDHGRFALDEEPLDAPLAPGEDLDAATALAALIPGAGWSPAARHAVSAPVRAAALEAAR
ncbi:radical SAM protein [Polymorphobacter sp.]|uniref:radical SAM protein n=1 Tax=Polymorphobacter sp. TaxID=1909290 RepID=UPI003F6FB301